ncbi:MAG: DUF4167 domain-containing protein [Rhizobiales bacterium]|nr:DUF4167 domain-containing protein [Hyphomicrobiales bacterium]
MRPGQHNKRGRNRNRRHSGGSGGGGGNPLNRVYESNGPDVKVRGTAQTVADKYLQLGRDALASGDIVMSESYFQHAEHYLRILAAAQAYNQQFQQQSRRPAGEDGYEDEDGDETGEGEGDELQPAVVERPVHGTPQPDAYGDSAAQEFDRPPQSQQSFRSRDRGGDRFRPRFDQNRDRQDASRDRDQDSPANRQEEAPARSESAQPEAAQTAAGGNWEAPSFLKRGAANGSGSEPARTRYPRRRRESAEASDTASGGSSRDTPAE